MTELFSSTSSQHAACWYNVPEHSAQRDRSWQRLRALLGVCSASLCAASGSAHAESMNALEPRVQTVQTVLDCRYPMCASRVEHVFVGAGGRPALGSAPPSALRRISGSWRIGWQSGLALNYAFVPNFSKANLSYAPDISFRCHVIKLTATFYFF